MKRLALLTVLAACGGGHKPTPQYAAQPQSAQSAQKPIAIEPVDAVYNWYRVPVPCGQGPYEVEVPVTGNKYGELVELRLATPHGIALHAVLYADGVEVARTDGSYDMAGPGAHVDNTRCIADKRERVIAARPGGSGSGTPVKTGTPVGDTPRAPQSTTAKLDITTDIPSQSITLITFKIPRATPKLVLRWWSVEPNDLGGVAFGVRKIEWRPNVPEAEYEAYLVRLEIEERESAARQQEERRQRARREEEAMQRRAQEEAAKAEVELRIRLEEQRQVSACRLEAERRARGEQVPAGDAAHAKLCRRIAAEDAEQERLAEVRRRAIEEARRRAELDRPRREAEEGAARERARAEREHGEAEARRRALELEISAQREAESLAELQRRRQAELAAERERKLKRERFCNSHPDDRDCWGAGGMKVTLELEQRRHEREQFCTTHQEDVRCWSSEQVQKLRDAGKKRVEIAVAPPKPPDGPPPAPLAEEAPPKLSAHAEWRPGYWHWLDGQWVWLAGVWNVPNEDIVAEQTTTAPDAPPPPRSEAPPPAPVRSAVWVAGFWQWNGTSWVWIAGSYQLRPPQMSWRAPEWRARGSVHVLVPGGWIRIGGSR